MPALPSMSCIRGQRKHISSDEYTNLVEKHTMNGTVKATTPSPTTTNTTPSPTTTTTSGSSAITPTLGHIDFWPSCQNRALMVSEATFENFEVLVTRANRWLEQFPDFEMISCESVDKKVLSVQDIYSAASAFVDEENLLASHIKGLRLWYTQRRLDSPPSAHLAFMDIVPKYLNPGEKHPKFESLPVVIDNTNLQLQQQPLPGKIVSVESVLLKIPEEVWCPNIRINSQQCNWLDEYNTHQLCFLRVFYLVGQPHFELIGLIDFAPDTLKEGGIFQPAQYSPFSALVEKANKWIKDTTNVRITNFHTLEIKHRKKSENHGKRFNTEKMFEFKIEHRFRSLVLRVGYVVPMLTDSSRATWPRSITDLTSRTYLPRSKGATYENITEIMERIEACINATGADVIHVETVAIPEWMTEQRFCEKGERTFFDGEWYFVSDKDGNAKGPYRYTTIYALRLYFDGKFVDPPFMRMPSFGPPDKGPCCVVM